MPRPYESDPVNMIIDVTRALGPWYDKHKKALSVELGTNYDGKAEAQKNGDTLQKHEKVFIKERKDDEKETTSQNNLLTEIRTFVKSVGASVKRRTKGHKNHKRIYEDFHVSAPSQIRSFSVASGSLRQLETGIEVHRKDIQGTNDRSADWLKKISGFEDRLKHSTHKKLDEKTETSDARLARDEARGVCVDFIEDMELAALAVVDHAPEAYLELQGIFETLNPTIAPPQPPPSTQE